MKRPWFRYAIDGAPVWFVVLVLALVLWVVVASLTDDPASSAGP
jgi:hypothetical protein